MPEGKIEALKEKGFGFIKPDGASKAIFFHSSELKGIRFDQLAVGDRVSFETAMGEKGEVAKHIRSIGAGAVAQAMPRQVRPAQAPHTRTNQVRDQDPVATGGFNLPYRFAPIDLNLALADQPVWHDGSSAGARYSGEILCSLEALTPLMPGNFHYKAAQLDLDRQKAKLPDGWSPAADKNVVEPLRLASGHVLIAGSALKGMLRHSFAALVAGPMERVAEHHYTYRTNLAHGNGQFECRPAVVRKLDGGEWFVDILPSGRNSVLFIRGGVTAKDDEVIKNGTPGKLLPEVSVDVGRGQKPLLAADTHYFCRYKGGIDGTGDLFREFKKSNSSKVHGEALVPKQYWGQQFLKVLPEVYAQYENTQARLADAQSNKSIANHIRRATALEVNQLIYAEVRLEHGKPVKVVSLGHHHHYRWAYTSSVRKKNGKLRPELGLLEGEQVRGDAQDSLAAARGLFGYTHSRETPLGKKAYQRLAGRVAINHALSDGVPEFLNEDKNHWVAFKVLGQPRPSAWEFYLKQDESKPFTYGDTVDEEGGDLAGRKFYLHQPQCQAQDYEAEGEGINSNQATLARYVVAPKAKFRFTVRFRDLRDWELGALLATLEPGRMAVDGKVYAHKLGLGRPLGLGSVALKVDQLNCWNGEQQLDKLSDEVQKQLLQAFTQKAKTKGEGWQPHLDRWLALHRYQAVQNAAGYPVKEGEIYGWHTDLRRQYIKQRRAGTLENFQKKTELQQAHAIEPEQDPSKASKP